MPVGQGHKGDLMLMDPLSELSDVLRNDIGLRGVADDITGHEQLALRIDDRNGGGFLADCIDHQDPVTSNRPLEHDRFEVFHSRFDQSLIGIFFEDGQDILLESRQKEFFESGVGHFHQQWVHRMPARAERIAAKLHKVLRIDLELELDDLGSQSAREHQDLEGGQISDGLAQFAVGFEDPSQPASASLPG